MFSGLTKEMLVLALLILEVILSVDHDSIQLDTVAADCTEALL